MITVSRSPLNFRAIFLEIFLILRLNVSSVGSESLVVESDVSNPENRNKHQAQNETYVLLKTNVTRF